MNTDIQSKSSRNALREIEAKASGMRWRYSAFHQKDGGAGFYIYSNGTMPVAVIETIDRLGPNENPVVDSSNAKLICESRNALVPLLDYCDQLEQEQEVFVRDAGVLERELAEARALIEDLNDAAFGYDHADFMRRKHPDLDTRAAAWLARNHEPISH